MIRPVRPVAPIKRMSGSTVEMEVDMLEDRCVLVDGISVLAFNGLDNISGLLVCVYLDSMVSCFTRVCLRETKTISNYEIGWV